MDQVEATCLVIWIQTNTSKTLSKTDVRWQSVMSDYTIS